jgi:pimeloyl-ACP methyl ester carboxylesterase
VLGLAAPDVDLEEAGVAVAPLAVLSDALIQDLAQVARSVSDGPATLVGCSFGGLLSLHCALDHPQLVAALVLVGPIVSGLGFTEHFISRGGRAPAKDAPVAEQIGYWTRTDPWIVHPPTATRGGGCGRC